MAEYHGDIGWSSDSFYRGDYRGQNTTALILLVFLGALGVHRFYQSKPLTGLAQLTMFTIGVLFCGIFVSSSLALGFLVVLGLWLLFDLVMIVTALIQD